jgi:hypothetical protein
MAKVTPREKIEKLLEAAREALRQAAEVADAHDVEFRWNGPEDSYGFGGRYEPARTWQASGGCEWEESGEDTEARWISSSEDC